MIPARFAGYDEGRQTLGVYDTHGGQEWCLSLAELPLARDLQRLENRILVGFDQGFFEVDAATGTELTRVDRWSGVTSVRRLDNGDTVVAGVGLDGTQGITFLTLDDRHQVKRAVTRAGDYLRLVRPTPEGTWLLGADEAFLETSSDLSEFRRLAAPGFRHAWLAQRSGDGSTLVSAGYGAFLALFGADGGLIRTFGGAADVPPEVAPYFYASFERLSDGGLLVANWQGHGPDNGGKGRQLVQFAADGSYVDSSSVPGVSSLQGLLLLPGH